MDANIGIAFTNISNLTTTQNETLLGDSAVTTAESEDEGGLLMTGIILVTMVARFAGGFSFPLRRKGIENVTGSGACPAAKGRMSYLKSGLWWLGFFLFSLDQAVLGAVLIHAPGIVVGPLAVLVVPGSAIGGRLLLKEKLGHLGWLGCALATVSCAVFAVAAPKSSDVASAAEFTELLISPSFISFASVMIVVVGALTLLEYKLRLNNIVFYGLMTGSTAAMSLWLMKGLGVCLMSGVWLNWSFFVSAVANAICFLHNTYITQVASDIFEASLLTAVNYVSLSSLMIFTSTVFFLINSSTHIEIEDGFIMGLSFIAVLGSVLLLSSAKYIQFDFRILLKKQMKEPCDSSVKTVASVTLSAVNKGYVEESDANQNAV